MIEIVNASKVYQNGVRGIDEVSFDVYNGEFVFIVGASGSGKSTIIKLLMKEEELSSGEIVIDGKKLKGLPKREIPFLRRGMGVVFQDFRLLPNKTVFENVAFAMQITEKSYRDIRRNVPMVLSMVGLQRKSKMYPHQLSGGEQQRVALARAIVNRPPVLLADEPTGNLDPDTAWEIMTLLNDIHLRGTTVLVATHAWDIVEDLHKRVISLKKGRIVSDVEDGSE